VAGKSGHGKIPLPESKRTSSLIREQKRPKRANIILKIINISFKEKKPINSYRSPIITGCCFAGLFVFLSLLLTACVSSSGKPIFNIENSTYTPHSSQTEKTIERPLVLYTPTPPLRIQTTGQFSFSKPVDSVPPRHSSTPITTPTIEIVNTPKSDPNPVSISDLLFISDNRLMRWDHITQYSVTLAENVVEYSTSDSGDLVLMLRQRPITANGRKLYDVDILDFDTKQINRIMEELPDIEKPTLSPDGNWVVYRQTDNNQIYAFQPSNPEQRLRLGSCFIESAEDCQKFAWSPDSKLVLWIDSRSIWLANMHAESARDLTAGYVEIEDPEGRSVQIQAKFSLPLWSPYGRFVLIKVSPIQSNVRWCSILDTASGRMIQVVDSYALIDNDSSLAWLEDGTLAVAHASDPKNNAAPTIQLWSVIPTHPEVLVSKKLIQIESNRLSANIVLQETSTQEQQGMSLQWLQSMSSDHILVGVQTSGMKHEPILYDLDLKEETFNPIIQVPGSTKDILWSPDGSGFLNSFTDGRYSFYDIDSGETYLLFPTIDGNPHNFLWLPPELR
jgi:WD40 repeat protein